MAGEPDSSDLLATQARYPLRSTARSSSSSGRQLFSLLVQVRDQLRQIGAAKLAACP